MATLSSKKTLEEFLLIWDLYNRTLNLRSSTEKEEKTRIQAGLSLRKKIFDVLEEIAKEI